MPSAELCRVGHRNFADIVKTEDVVSRRWLGLSRTRTNIRKKVFQVSCSGMNETVTIGTLKDVRKHCQLREEDGVDSEAFYSGLDRVDYFLNAYRNILKKLSHQ
jgi:hypothetical protein